MAKRVGEKLGMKLTGRNQVPLEMISKDSEPEDDPTLPVEVERF